MALPNAEEQLQINPTLSGLALACADPDAPVDGLVDVGLVEVCLLLDEHAPATRTIVRAATTHVSLAGLAGRA
jgi:hypothetical protein